MAQQLATKIQNYYLIDPEASDDHSDATANGTIQWALNRISSGGVVELLPGTFNLKNKLTVTYSDTEIFGCGASSIIYLDQSTYSNKYYIDTNAKNNLTISKINFQGNILSYTSFPIFNLQNGSENIKITKNIFSDLYSCIFAGPIGTLEKITIEDNIFKTIYYSFFYGYNTILNNSVIKNNIIYFNKTHSITSSPFQVLNIQEVNNSEIIGNILYCGMSAGSLANFISINTGSYNTFSNNIIDVSATAGTITNSTCYLAIDNSTISENTIRSSASAPYTLHIAGSGGRNNIINNLIEKNTGNTYGLYIATASTNNVVHQNKVWGSSSSSDPQYIETTNAKFYYDGSSSKFESFPNLTGLHVTSVTTNYSVLPTDDIILAAPASANLTITLPAVSARVRPLYIFRNNANTYQILLSTSGGNTFHGSASTLVDTNYLFPEMRIKGGSITLYPDSGNSTWWSPNVKNEELLSNNVSFLSYSSSSTSTILSENISTVYINITTPSALLSVTLPQIQYCYKPITIIRCDANGHAVESSGITVLPYPPNQIDDVNFSYTTGWPNIAINMRNQFQCLTFQPVYNSAGSVKKWKMLRKGQNNLRIDDGYIWSPRYWIQYNYDHYIFNNSFSTTEAPMLPPAGMMQGRTIKITRNFSGATPLYVFPYSGETINGIGLPWYYSISTQYQTVAFTTNSSTSWVAYVVN